MPKTSKTRLRSPLACFVAGAALLSPAGWGCGLSEDAIDEGRTAGALTAETNVSSKDTPLAIPDSRASGVTSTITVENSILIEDAALDLDITHSFIGDLVVEVTTPLGTTFLLHDREGGSADNLRKTYLAESGGNSGAYDPRGEDSKGLWQINALDLGGGETGTLEGWALHLVGAPN